MRTLTSPLHIARHLLESKDPWFLFVEIPSLAVPGSFFRLVRNTRNLIANGVGWLGTAMEIDLPEEDGAGTLGTVTITVPNVSRIPMALVETDIGDGSTDTGDILGQIATAYLQPASALEEFVPALSWKHRVLRAEMNETTARFVCGHAGAARSSPGPRFDRRRFPQLLASAGQGVVRVSA